jgi:hypothetical protein
MLYETIVYAQTGLDQTLCDFILENTGFVAYTTDQEGGPQKVTICKTMKEIFQLPPPGFKRVVGVESENFGIQLNDEECEIIRFCEEEAKRQHDDMRRNQQYLLDEEMSPEDEEEMLEMWAEKLSRDGRVNARGGSVFSREEILEMITEKDEVKVARDLAMEEICSLDPLEFQRRLLKKELPFFYPAKRGDPDYPKKPLRNTCHSHTLLTQRDIDGQTFKWGEVHRKEIRHMGVDKFIAHAYCDSCLEEEMAESSEACEDFFPTPCTWTGKGRFNQEPQPDEYERDLLDIPQIVNIIWDEKKTFCQDI